MPSPQTETRRPRQVKLLSGGLKPTSAPNQSLLSYGLFLFFPINNNRAADGPRWLPRCHCAQLATHFLKCKFYMNVSLQGANPTREAGDGVTVQNQRAWTDP